MKTTTKDPTADMMKRIRAMIACGAETPAGFCRAVFGNNESAARVSMDRWTNKGTKPGPKNEELLTKHAARITLRIAADHQLASEYRKAFKAL